MTWEPNRDPHGCARCRKHRRAHPYLGCLCERCEVEVEGMTQAQLDADYETHKSAGSVDAGVVSCQVSTQGEKA